MQRVHFCSGAVFVTGDAIATSLLWYIRAVSLLRRSDVLTVPIIVPAGTKGTVTLLLNEAVQISAESVEFDGPELRDQPFVERVDALTESMLQPAIWDSEAVGGH